MFCIGYGIKAPANGTDTVLTCLSMLCGALMFALFLGQVTSVVQSINVSKHQYKEKMMQVKEYMSFRKFPMDLRHRMDDYYEHRFQGKMFDEAAILSELNPVLREELINHNCCELIEAVPFFRNADADFLSNMISCLKYEVYLNGDCIVKQGTIGSRMYFISRGTVLIRSQTKAPRTTTATACGYPEDDEIQMEQRLSDGAYFGEICLLLDDYRCSFASVYADSIVNCYALEREDFDRVLEFHPEQKTLIKKQARERMETALEEDELENLDLIGEQESHLYMEAATRLSNSAFRKNTDGELFLSKEEQEKVESLK